MSEPLGVEADTWPTFGTFKRELRTGAVSKAGEDEDQTRDWPANSSGT